MGKKANADGGAIGGAVPFFRCPTKLVRGAGVEQENQQRMASSLRPPGSSLD